MGLQEQVIRHLASGQWCSGSEIAAALGVSRAAVWKHVQTLPTLGLPVSATAGRGYRLHRPLDLLNPRVIIAALDSAAKDALDELAVVPVTDSTSDDLLARPGPGVGRLVARFAEYQTRGRGRRGRAWLSPYGGGLCMSIAVSLPGTPRDLPALSLAMGVVVRRVLSQGGGEDIGLKWPNDLLTPEGKIAGILVDVSGESGGPLKIVVGLGVNIALPEQAARLAAVDGTSLPAATRFANGIAPPRNVIAAALVSSIFDALTAFGSFGFRPFVAEWRAHDYLSGRAVEVAGAAQPQTGIALGIADDGSLQIETPVGVVSIVAGDVSVKPRP